MHLAVLMTNTDESDFAQRHPKDGQKFSEMIQAVRPDWKVTSFAVKDGVFPDDISLFDGIMITGSPASVHDGEPWIEELERLIRVAYRMNRPLFGACFGHQAIAKALGGTVSDNPNGWVFGIADSEVISPPDWAPELSGPFRQYAAHVEQVTKLPEGAKIWASAPYCGAVGFTIGKHVFTTQNHPEMTHGFMEALIDEYAAKLPNNVVQTARQSLHTPVNMQPFAETIARFFEQAH